ncbi:hypothetical protein GA0070609_6546 [Micromonospora echinaurantiaca]|uniref:Uncharacterized protein n=1 Tax=Micromonospora echinaurantiaca TaxID=47857 RepID=A0A1C5KD03_9ACTN|nr:hypothetical protein [Micromonospora echinaurantiaca]SCG80620.1 hypothetical protein GA0070609_6546 [Micromonospora echinaurantiaca]
MPTRPRPLVAVRLIGPTASVTAHAATIAAQLAAYYGREHVTCRTSTRPAGYSGESRAYITITRKESS